MYKRQALHFLLSGLGLLFFGPEGFRTVLLASVGADAFRVRLTLFVLAALLAGLIGVLIAPVTTMYYDSGFIIGLKAFVAAIIGGLVSYPMTAIGALAVGVVESFASFWSGALKDVIVFSLLIPVLMLRSFLSVHEEEEEEVDQ